MKQDSKNKIRSFNYQNQVNKLENIPEQILLNSPIRQSFCTIVQAKRLFVLSLILLDDEIFELNHESGSLMPMNSYLRRLLVE